MTERITSERGYSTSPRWHAIFRVGVSGPVFAFALLAGGSAHAVNGEDETTVGHYESATCQDLRATSGGTDIVFACFLASDGARICSRVAPTGGAAVGFCADGVFGGVPPSKLGDAVLEADTQIQESSFGKVANLDTLSAEDADTYCQTYPPVPVQNGKKGGGPKSAELPPPGRKFCVTFVPGAPAPADDLAHPLPVVQDQAVCDEVAAGAQGSVRVGAVPEFVALMSVDLNQEAQPTELVACAGVGWDRTDGLVEDAAQKAVSDIVVLDTPWLVCLSKSCR